jgi:hypothetical protein
MRSSTSPVSPILVTVVALVLIAFAGCDNRTIPATDDAGSGQADSRPGADIDRPAPDACVRPAGSCYSEQDCPKGWACAGCDGDPCCPMCTVCVGTCTPPPPGGCTDNSGCASDHYCHVDGACQATGAKMGQCRVRPKDKYCDTFGPMVCGCDGKMYGCEELAHAAGVNLSTDPHACKSCGELEQAYAAALLEAKACDLFDPSLHCTHTVDNALACPCPTRVELGAASLPTLAQLKQVWNAKGCGTTIDCAAIPCKTIKHGSCVGASPPTAGVCNDIHN